MLASADLRSAQLALTTWAEENLPTEPIINLFTDMVRRKPIEVPDLRFEPITPSRDELQVLPGEFVPLALDPALRLRPHAFDHRPIHRSPLRYALSSDTPSLPIHPLLQVKSRR